jgi:tetratricopeptide (TPR) repeat protein
VLALAVIVVYANSLSGPFMLDDEATVVQNSRIRDLSRLDEVLIPVADSPVAGRPLPSLTFALNYAAGGLDVRGYHAMNIFLHLVCVLLVFIIARRTLRLPRLRGLAGADAENIAFAAALLWAVHPLNSEVVNYLSQRTESLMAACYLAALYAAIRAADPRRMRRWPLLAVLACALGATAKESIVTAPMMVALYDRTFLFESWGSAFAQRWRLYAGLLGSWVVAAASNAGGPRSAVVGFSTGVSPWTYLLNQAEIITHYLRLTIWPDALVAFYGWPASLSMADVAPEFAFLATLVVLTGVAWWKWPIAGFLGAWFFVTLSPASSLLPVATEVGAERRMYLPLIALAFLLSGSVAVIVRRQSAVPRWVPTAVWIVVAGGLMAATAARNRDYRSSLALAQTVIARRPTPIAHHWLAEQLVRSGQADAAIPHLHEAIAGGDSRAAYILGRLLLEQGKQAEGIDQLQAFVRTSELPHRLVPRWLEPPITELVPARIALGRALALRGDWTQAADQATRVLQVVPSHAAAHGLLGDVMFAQEQWGAAAEHYRRYLERQPADVRVLMNYGITQVAIGRLNEAIDAFTRATRIDPANVRAKQLLALAREDQARLASPE